MCVCLVYLSQRSFLTMSRCCVKSVYGHQRTLCSTTRCRLTCSLKLTFELLKIDILSSYLEYSHAIHHSSIARYLRQVAALPVCRELVFLSAFSGSLLRQTCVGCYGLVYGVVSLVLGCCTTSTAASNKYVDLDLYGRMVEVEAGNASEAGLKS